MADALSLRGSFGSCSWSPQESPSYLCKDTNYPDQTRTVKLHASTCFSNQSSYVGLSRSQRRPTITVAMQYSSVWQGPHLLSTHGLPHRNSFTNPALTPAFSPASLNYPHRKNWVLSRPVTARWGKRRVTETNPTDEKFPGPPDARNLGKLSKVLPFSVYELQRLEFARDLTEGDYGADVEALQRAMHTFGHMPKDSQITGYYGKATFVAVREWQRSQGLPGTGYWGPMSQETFADVVQRHAEAQEALVTQASPTQGLVNRVNQTVTAVLPVRLPRSAPGGVGFGLGLALTIAGVVGAVLRLRAGLRQTELTVQEDGFQGKAEEVRPTQLSYQGRWGRPEVDAASALNPNLNPAQPEANGLEQSRETQMDDGESSGALLDNLGQAFSEGLSWFGRALNEGPGIERPETIAEEDQRLRDEDGLASGSGRLKWEERGEGAGQYSGVLDYQPTQEELSYEEEIAQLQESIEALVKELSAVEVQRQAALKALDDERQRSAQLELRLDHKVQAIAALQAEIKSLKTSQRTQLTASHLD